MYLSNRLTFSIFSLLLIAVFVFVAAPAMAQTTVTAYSVTTTADDTADPKVVGKVVITFTYSENPDPVPVLADFTAPDNTIPPNDDSDARDPLTGTFNQGASTPYDRITAAIARDGKTVTLTLTGSTTVTPTVPTGLMLKGYSTDFSADLNNATDAASALTLSLAAGYIGGKTYVVYVRGDDATQAALPVPVLPSSLTGTGGLPTDTGTLAAADGQLVRTIDPTDETGNSNMAMPDLEKFFNVGGGTIKLNVEGTGANSKHLIINEIMWGLDNSKVGQVGHTNQQWIEVYNRLTTPAPAPEFEFINNTFPAPAVTAGTSDWISNIAGHQNVWNPPIKGSSGTATRNTDGSMIIGANPAFVSLYRSKQDGDGANAGHWTASNRAYFPGFMGTPGGANTRGGLPGTRPNPSAYTPPKDKVIINEVGNYMNSDHDWIELRNVTNAEQSIKDWRLNRTDGTNRTEHNIVKFPDIKIPAGEVLLFVNVAPIDHPELIAGFDVQLSANNQQRGAGPQKYRKISGLIIPNSGNGLLILRSHGDNKFQKSRAHLHDAVGYSRVTHNTIDSGEKEPEAGNTYWKTDAWPINGHSGDNYRAYNAKDSNNNNASLDPNQGVFKVGQNNTAMVWARSGTAHGWRKGGGSHVGYVGGLGYQRGVMGKGTPGYHNDAVKNVVANLGGGQLVISELMLTTDNGRYPQWIELHNTSKTNGIDLQADGTEPKVGWRMIIENHNSGKWKTAASDKTYITINLKDLFRYIPPNQTVLIVSDVARNSQTTNSKHFPNHRVVSIWEKKRGEFLMKDRRDTILNAEGGFYIKIIDANNVVSDEIGNLDGKAASLRGAVPYDDAFGWSWLGGTLEDAMGKTLADTLTDRNERTSLIRLKNADKTYRAGTPIRPVADDPETADVDETVAANVMRGSVIPLGTDETMFSKDAAWVHAVDTRMARAKFTYYGAATDKGTPGHTANTPLPVELSFFRPTLENGKVTIQWTTESELDNAGFNILRSETRNGEFTQVNEQMIQGKGTTAQRSTYKWVDTTAKPGAVYYYQIEDVSFAGEHTKLATTKLKGLISAKGKLTTSWGDIKNASQ